MKNIVLGCSPITPTIYAGKLNKAKTMWVKGSKVDVTETCFDSMAEFLMNHKCPWVFKNKEGKEVTIVLKEIEAES